MVFHWSLSDSKSLQVSWNHLSILANLSNAVVWIVSNCPLISNSSSLCMRPFMIQWIIIPTQISLVLYYLCANLLYSFISYFVIDHFVFCHDIVYICYFVVSYLFWLMALFCAAVRRDSVSILMFPFLSHVQVFLWKILLVCHLKYPYCCFSYHFCFLVIFFLLMLVLSVLFQVAIISLPPCIFM